MIIIIIIDSIEWWHQLNSSFFVSLDSIGSSYFYCSSSIEAFCWTLMLIGNFTDGIEYILIFYPFLERGRKNGKFLNSICNST